MSKVSTTGLISDYNEQLKVKTKELKNLRALG